MKPVEMKIAYDQMAYGNSATKHVILDTLPKRLYAVWMVLRGEAGVFYREDVKKVMVKEGLI